MCVWSRAWLQLHQQKAPSGLKQKRIKTTGFTGGQRPEMLIGSFFSAVAEF